MNCEVATSRSTGMDGQCEEIARHTKLHLSSHDYTNSFTNGEENYSGSMNRRSRLSSSGNNDTSKHSWLFTNHNKMDEEYAAAQTTEAILAKIFGEKAPISKQRNFEKTYSNGEVFGQHQTTENYNGIEAGTRSRNSSIEIESGNMRNKSSITNTYNDTSPKHFSVDERNNEDSSHTKCGYIGNDVARSDLQAKLDLKETTYGREMFPYSDVSQTDLGRNAGNHPTINGVRRLYQDTSSKQRSSFENVPPFLDKYSTFNNIPLTRPDTVGRTQATESLSRWRNDQDNNSSTLMRSVNIATAKTSKQITSRRTPLVQSNVVDYYETLKNEQQTSRETTGRMTPRKGLRSKSSEMPVKNNLQTSCSPYG